jgi:hypothetical protein
MENMQVLSTCYQKEKKKLFYANTYNLFKQIRDCHGNNNQ